MTEMVNKCLLAWQEVSLCPQLRTVQAVNLLRTKKGFKNLWKQQILVIFIGTIWLMPATKTWSKEQNEDVKFTPGPPTKREPVGHGCPPTPPTHHHYIFLNCTLPGMFSRKFAFASLFKASKTFLASALQEYRPGPCILILKIIFGSFVSLITT